EAGVDFSVPFSAKNLPRTRSGPAAIFQRLFLSGQLSYGACNFLPPRGLFLGRRRSMSSASCLLPAGVSRAVAAMTKSRSDLATLATSHFLARKLASAALASFLVLTPCLDAAALPLPTAVSDKKSKQDPALKGLPITELSADEAILHALNRLAYGPRPGDVERIKKIGLAKWIDQQLNPKSIDDSAVETPLAA